MLEIAVGTLLLLLGWLCLDHASRMRARYSVRHTPRSRFHGVKPLMIVPWGLGVLLVLNGLAILAFAASARLRLADGLEDLVSLELLLTLAPAAAALVLAARSRRGRGNRGRERPLS